MAFSKISLTLEYYNIFNLFFSHATNTVPHNKVIMVASTLKQLLLCSDTIKSPYWENLQLKCVFFKSGIFNFEALFSQISGIQLFYAGPNMILSVEEA